MRSINIFFTILAIYVASSFGAQTEKFSLPNSFRFENLGNKQFIWTPFAEFFVYSSDLPGNSEIGEFISVSWDPMSRILKLVTDEGEEARFSQISEDGEEWYFVNIVNGIMSPGKKLTYVGLQMADMMNRFSAYIKGKITEESDRTLCVADSAGRPLWKENFLIGVGGYKSKIIEGKWFILISPDGENFSDDTPMGQVKSHYIAFYPSISPNENGKIAPGWNYVIGDTQSGFAGTIAENLGKFLK